MAIREQLELLGFEETLRQADAKAASPAERARNRRRVEVAHEIMSSLPQAEDLNFLHSGLCQTHLPRSRPASNRDVWIRSNGRFQLVIQPGMLADGVRPSGGRTLSDTEQETMFCGVPYGPKARLILIWLQSEGVKSRIVSMDKSMSAWIRSLGLAVTGGKTGSIQLVREQALRIAQCSFSLQWSDVDGSGNSTKHIQNTRIVDGMELWQAAGDASKWATSVQLSETFHAHLREHAVPLDSRAIAHLAGNSLGLDLYAFFAHRLNRLKADLLLRWKTLSEQFGGEGMPSFRVAQWIKDTLPDVVSVYTDANVEVVRHGLLLRPSKPPIPKMMVAGRRLTLIS